MTDSRKVAVISGGMGDVGRATAAAFSEADYRVALLYRNSSATEIADMRASLSGEHLFLHCDVSNEQEVAKVIDELYAETGRIDVAIHAAVDPIKRENLLAMDGTAFRSQFEAGFFGAFNFLRPVARIMKEARGGTLIGITSNVLESPITPARMGAYTVGKIAFRGLLRELHRELSSSGVRVLAIAPGLMRTKLNADLPNKFFEMAEASGGALMKAEDVARAIVNVCSDSAVSSGLSYLVSSGETTPL